MRKSQICLKQRNFQQPESSRDPDFHRFTGNSMDNRSSLADKRLLLLAVKIRVDACIGAFGRSSVVLFFIFVRNEFRDR